MRELNRPWPEIARFPGEPKLEGVPHLKRESIFAETGVYDALELTNQTHELNSAQRRPIIERALGRLSRMPDEAEAILTGLTTITNPEVLDNPDKRRNASYLKSTIEEKLVCKDAPAKEAVSITAVSEKSARDGSWALGLLRLGVEKHDSKKMNHDPYLHRVVGGLVVNNNPNDPAVIEAGVKLFKRYDSDSKSPADSCITFANLAFAIDAAKQKATNRRHSTVVSNLIIGAAGSTLAAELPLDQETHDLINRFLQIAEEDEKAGGWMHPKWVLIERQLRERREIADFAGRFSKIDRLLGSSLEGQDINGNVAEAMNHIYDFRRYGIKPAYFRDGMLHCNDDSWVIFNLEDYLPESYEGYVFPDIAGIALAHAKNIDDIRGEWFEKSIGEGRMMGRSYNYNSHYRMTMMKDGELTLMASQGVIPLRREFETAGASNLYEWLRLSHASRLIDLVVPATMISEMPKVKQNAGFIGKMINMMKLFNVQKLVLPRLRLINENTEQIIEELDRELEEAEERTKRMLRLHEVVDHVRILPPGYGASPEARARAEQLGIKLAPNETFVKKHRRGDGEPEIKSHKAVRKSGFFTR